MGFSTPSKSVDVTLHSTDDNTAVSFPKDRKDGVDIYYSKFCAKKCFTITLETNKNEVDDEGGFQYIIKKKGKSDDNRVKVAHGRRMKGSKLIEEFCLNE